VSPPVQGTEHPGLVRIHVAGAVGGQRRPGPGLLDHGHLTDACPDGRSRVDRHLRATCRQNDHDLVGHTVEDPHGPCVDVRQQVGQEGLDPDGESCDLHDVVVEHPTDDIVDEAIRLGLSPLSCLRPGADGSVARDVQQYRHPRGTVTEGNQGDATVAVHGGVGECGAQMDGEGRRHVGGGWQVVRNRAAGWSFRW